MPAAVSGGALTYISSVVASKKTRTPQRHTRWCVVKASSSSSSVASHAGRGHRGNSTRMAYSTSTRHNLQARAGSGNGNMWEAGGSVRVRVEGLGEGMLSMCMLYARGLLSPTHPTL